MPYVMKEQVGNPTAVANKGTLYVKDSSGVTQLYYQADDGTITQVTGGGGGGMAIGGSITSATAGSVLFAGVAGVLAQDNAHLFWDDTNNRLQVGSVLNPASWTFAVIPSGPRDGVGVYAGGAAPDDYPTMSFLRFRGTLALPTTVLTGDILGRLAFSAHNGSTFDGGGSDGGFIGVASQNWSAFNIGTKYQIRPIPTGTSVALNGFEVSGEAVVVNPDGVNLDFRVASDTDANNLFSDGTNNRIGIGTATPTSKFSIGASSEFQVNTTGNLVKINNVTTSFPAVQGAASTVLTNDGAGNLTWAAAGGGGMAIGGSITSATAGSVLFAGAAGILQQDNANFFWNDTTNRLGIGTNIPAGLLHVYGSGTIIRAELNDTTSTVAIAAINEGGTLAALLSGGQTQFGNFLTASPLIAAGGVTYVQFSGGQTAGAIRNFGTSPFVIFTNDIERVRFNGTASLGEVHNSVLNDYDVTFNGTAANLMFLDASANRVGVGTATPATTLHLESSSNSGAPRVRISNTSNTGSAQGMLELLNNAGHGFQFIQTSASYSGTAPFIANRSVVVGAYAAGVSPALEFICIDLDGQPRSIGFWLGDGATNFEKFRINNAEAVFNDPGNNYDFRVEGDTDANLFFVDASTDRIGIGTSTPATVLNVVTAGASTVVQTQNTTTTGVSRFILRDDGGTNFLSMRTNGSAVAGTFLGYTDASAHYLETNGSGGAFFIRNSGATPIVLTVGSVENLTVKNTEVVVNEAASSAIDFRVETANTANAFFIDASANAVIVNDDGSSTVSFRVEGDTNANLIFTDATNDRVGIGTGAPATLLEVSTATATTVTQVKNTSTTGVAQSFVRNDGSEYIQVKMFGTAVAGTFLGYTQASSSIIETSVASGSAFVIRNVGTAPTVMSVNEVERFTIKSTEVVVNEPASDTDFRVEGSATRANLFLIDAGQARVGINRAATTLGATLDIDNLAVAESIFIARDNGTAVFTIDDGGALTQEGGAVFNEAGGNFDFRVEGDTEANLLFVDASTNRVGIGTVTPTATLHVQGSTVLGAASGAATSAQDTTVFNSVINDGAITVGGAAPNNISMVFAENTSAVVAGGITGPPVRLRAISSTTAVAGRSFDIRSGTGGTGSLGGIMLVRSGTGGLGSGATNGGDAGTLQANASNGGAGGTSGAGGLGGDAYLISGSGGAAGTTTGLGGNGGECFVLAGNGAAANTGAGTGAAGRGGFAGVNGGNGGAAGTGAGAGAAGSGGSAEMNGGLGGAGAGSVPGADAGVAGIHTNPGFPHGVGGAGTATAAAGRGSSVLINGGPAGAANGGVGANGGNVDINAGVATGSGTDGTISIGTASTAFLKTSGITIGLSTKTATFQGSVTIPATSSADRLTLNSIPYIFPAAIGTAGQVLGIASVATPNVLTWAAAATGTVTGTGSSGAVAFWSGASAITQDASNLFWDDTNNRVGVGTSAPAQVLDVRGAIVGQLFVSPKTGATSPAAADSRTAYTNEGAAAQVNFTLPGAAAGLEYTFVVQDTDGIIVTAAAGDTIRIAGGVSATGGTADAATIGNTLRLLAINATEWISIAHEGTWTLT